MKLEIHSYKTGARPEKGYENEFDTHGLIKIKTYECDTMDRDMKQSPKDCSLYKVIIDDVVLNCCEDIDDLIDFLKNSKKSFEI
jgi:hypothetical protein